MDPAPAARPSIGQEEIAQRRVLGLDLWDEVWNGDYRVAPSPSYEHQRLKDELVVFLLPLFRQDSRGTLLSELNVFNEGSERLDFRIPDLVFVRSSRPEVLAEDGIRGGPPDAVVEIRSPRDASLEKLSFYARLGVEEVVVIDRDTKHVDLYRLEGTPEVDEARGEEAYRIVPAAPDGWVASRTMEIELRGTVGTAGTPCAGPDAGTGGPETPRQPVRPEASRSSPLAPATARLEVRDRREPGAVTTI